MIPIEAQAVHVEALLGHHSVIPVATLVEARDRVVPSLIVPRVSLAFLARRWWDRGRMVALSDGSDLAAKLAAAAAVDLDVTGHEALASILKGLGEFDPVSLAALRELLPEHLSLQMEPQDAPTRSARRDAAQRLDEILADDARERRLLTVHEERFLLQATRQWAFTDGGSGEEKRLGRLAHHELITRNLRLVWKYVRTAQNSRSLGCLDEEDLFQTGCMGLAQAIRKFDPNMGARLGTYATFWIKQYIARSIMTDSRLIYVPIHRQERARAAARAADSTASAGPVPESSDDTVGIPRVIDISRADGDEDGGGAWETVAGTGDAPPVILERTERAAFVQKVLGQLKPRERDVLVRRFGIDRPATQTLEEVAAFHGVTRERIRQIEVKTLEQLQRVHNKQLRSMFGMDP